MMFNDLTPIYPPSSSEKSKMRNAFLARKSLAGSYLWTGEEARKHPLIRL